MSIEGTVNPIQAPRVDLPTNRLLLAPEPEMSLTDLLMLRKAGQSGIFDKLDNDSIQNLVSVSESTVHQLHELYGAGAMFRLFIMASSHTSAEFEHYLQISEFMLTMRNTVWKRLTPSVPHFDNDQLRQGTRIGMVNSLVLQPSLSRKIYNPGTIGFGSMVYGVGGPKILVSHPFKGARGEEYDAYANSLDIVTSLVWRGYEGHFAFLDNIISLNFDINSIPVWLLLFSQIAVDSDLVVFVRNGEQGFSMAQTWEIEMTPDHVKKRIVDLPPGELTWAKDSPDDASAVFYLDVDGIELTEPEFRERELGRILGRGGREILDNYSSRWCPDDRFIVIDENGDITEYPLDYPMYVHRGKSDPPRRRR